MLPSVTLRVDLHQTAEGVEVRLTFLGATLPPDAAAPPRQPSRRSTPPPAQHDWARAVLAALPTDGTRTRRDLTQALNSNASTIMQALHALLAHGQVLQEGAGVRNDPYRYRKVARESGRTHELSG